MRGKPPGPLVLGIVAALEKHGRLTRVQLCRIVSIGKRNASCVLSRMTKATKVLPKRIYVVDYVFEDYQGRRYPRAVYALGDKPDAPYPGADPRGACKRYRAKRSKLLAKATMSSVFHIGLSKTKLKKVLASEQQHVL